MKAKHPFWQNSQCRRGYLHRFSVKDEYPEGVLEVCEICHKKQFFKIIDGKVDNRFYMSYHIRQALPQFHPLYEREFPKEDIIVSPYQYNYEAE